MIENTLAPTRPVSVERRSFLRAGSLLTLSGAAVAALAGQPALSRRVAAHEGSTSDDIVILNTALGAEREAIAAYQLGAESGLLSAGVKAVALQFQDHHKQHADVLANTIGTLGGTADEPATHYDFPTEGLKAEKDVLAFAAGLEKGAVSAYLGAVPLFSNPDLARAAASILGDEAMHWAVLRHALGLDPVPVAFVT